MACFRTNAPHGRRPWPGHNRPLPLPPQCPLRNRSWFLKLTAYFHTNGRQRRRPWPGRDRPLPYPSRTQSRLLDLTARSRMNGRRRRGQWPGHDRHRLSRWTTSSWLVLASLPPNRHRHPNLHRHPRNARPPDRRGSTRQSSLPLPLPTRRNHHGETRWHSSFHMSVRRETGPQRGISPHLPARRPSPPTSAQRGRGLPRPQPSHPLARQRNPIPSESRTTCLATTFPYRTADGGRLGSWANPGTTRTKARPGNLTHLAPPPGNRVAAHLSEEGIPRTARSNPLHYPSTSLARAALFRGHRQIRPTGRT
jgi:hypothetical protein